MKMRSCDFQVAILLLALFAACAVAPAQWQIQNSNTAADLRGIHAVDANVAWASGTNGTVLRTLDGGANWQVCDVPPGAEKLDFRGIQAFDAKTAIVMSSGKGDLSRLYKTTDGCRTWKLVFTNPDKDGFWDSVQFKGPADYPSGETYGMILGDPVGGSFVIEYSVDGGDTWMRYKLPPSEPKEGAFAASNSALFNDWGDYGVEIFGTGGPGGSRLFTSCGLCRSKPFDNEDWVVQAMPGFGHGSSAGIFSIAARSFSASVSYVVVGGDFSRPNEAGSATYSQKLLKWNRAETPPHGYQSAVAYDAAAKEWITVGPNGTDVSTDDGKNWHALKPDVARGEAADTDRNWNALSLPFVVGPKGRIGKLNFQALAEAAR